jgi:hypothetical protein
MRPTAREIRSACVRNGSDNTRSLGSALRNVICEIIHCRAITLSRFIKPGKNKHERAVQSSHQHPQMHSVLGGMLAWIGVLALGGVLYRGLSAGGT